MITQTQQSHPKNVEIKELKQIPQHPLASKDQAVLDSVNFLQNKNLYNAIVVFLKLKRPT